MGQNNSKINAVAERDRCWAELRGSEDEIAELMKGKKDMESGDFILFFQCIAIVLTEITIYEKDFLDVDEETGELLKDNSISGSLMRTLREAGYWKDMVNKKISNEKRLKALEKLRKNMWSSMVLKKDKIIELMSSFPKLDNVEDMHVMMQCMAMVGLEINLKGREIELLY